MLLELRGLQKFYGQNEVVKPFDLSIQEGEFFSLLGPSGCGKTTLLRMIAGFESQSQGEVWFKGSRMDLTPSHKRPFNMVFQRYALFPHLSVYKNVAFGLEMKGVKTFEQKARIKEALELVQMDALKDRSVQTLSGGQQQRVALARALVNRPAILLLDEPLSALDLKLRRQMQVELLTLQRRLGTTFIFVTHDQEEALTLSNRIAVMNQGTIEQVGTAQEIYEFPRTPFVAQFIGSMNILSGVIFESTEQAASVQLSGVKRPVLIRPSRDGSKVLSQCESGTQVQVYMRPEKLRILKSMPGLEQNGLEGTIKEILYQGPMTHFLVQLKNVLGDSVLQIVQANTAMTARKTFNVGDKVIVAWLPEDCLLMKTDKTTASLLLKEAQKTETLELFPSPLAVQGG